MVQRSVKLPIMISAPVLLMIGVVAAFLLLPEPPAPPPQPQPQPLDNTSSELPPDNGDEPLPAEIDPRPRPRPNDGAPDTAAEADAMLSEAWGAMEGIRSRLELKYKYADYKLDRELTLEGVMRKLSRLDGKYFKGADYALSYPEGEGDTVLIECRTIDGRALPDGPLSMIVDMRTGTSELDGMIFARDAQGYVLLGDEGYRTLTTLMRTGVFDHYAQQQAMPDELAPLNTLLPDDPPEPFTATDFKAESVGELGYRLSCTTVRGEALAVPVSIDASYITNTISTTSASSEDWMRPPGDRERLKNRIDGLLEGLARSAAAQLNAGAKPGDLRMYLLGGSWWYFRWSELTPFDVKLEVSESTPHRVTLTVATSFGRPLPFKAVRFVATPPDDEGSYAD